MTLLNITWFLETATLDDSELDANYAMEEHETKLKHIESGKQAFFYLNEIKDLELIFISWGRHL